METDVIIIFFRLKLCGTDFRTLFDIFDLFPLYRNCNLIYDWSSFMSIHNQITLYIKN